MQISTTKDALFAPLALVSGAADSRGQIPMLSTILFRTLNGRLSLLCSDSTVLARSLAPCTIEKEGTFAVDARRFGDLIHALPDKQDINLALDDKTLLVKCGRSRFKLPVFAAADYPRMQPVEEKRTEVTMSAKQLGVMLEQISDSMAVNDVRATLNGALLSIGNGFLTVVGTNGHRMAIAKEALGGDVHAEVREIILPRRTVILARKLLAQGDMVKVALGSRDAHFTLNDGTIIIAHAIDGVFPQWERAIPATIAEAVVSSRSRTQRASAIGGWRGWPVVALHRTRQEGQGRGRRLCDAVAAARNP